MAGARACSGKQSDGDHMSLSPQERQVSNIKRNFFSDTQQLEGGSSDLLFWTVSFVLTVSPPFPYSHSAFCMAAMSIIPNLFAHWLGKLKQSVSNFKKRWCFFVMSVRQE